MTSEQEKLVEMARRFWESAESPSESDMEKLFLCLVLNDTVTLDALLSQYGLPTEGIGE